MKFVLEQDEVTIQKPISMFWIQNACIQTETHIYVRFAQGKNRILTTSVVRIEHHYFTGVIH